MLADLGVLLVRAVVGALFIGHGLQKLAGWFNGPGLAGTGQWMESLGLRPGRAWAALAGTLETLGGLCFGLGLFNPVGTVFISAVMLAAITRVHWPRGIWVSNGGYEYALTNLTVAVAVALIGPGRYALDPYFGLRLPVIPVLAYGLIGALLVLAIVWVAGQRVPWTRQRTA